MQEILNELNKGINLRQNVAKLKKLAQEDANLHIDIQLIKKLLLEEDWKVRKNLISTLAFILEDEYVDLLFNQYSIETNYIVKVEIIEVLSQYSISKVGDRFEMIMEHLSKIDDPINDRHIQEMISIIMSRLAKSKRTKTPVFTGLDRDTSVVLTCLKCNQDLLYNRIVEPKKKVGLGVMVKVDDLKKVEKYREYEEVLFLLSNFKDVDFDYNAISDALMGSNLFALLNQMHEACPYYLFRVDTSHCDPALLKNDFVKKLSMQIQAKSNHRLYNSSSSYNIELQIRMMKDHKARMFLKLYTYQDPRFRYRVESTSGSMQPYIAASIIQLIRPYLIEDADVLDLCCGTGTLLIEKNYELKSHFAIGVDIFNQAIEAAKKNTKIARMNINYVNRSFDDFKHPHLFDEVISDLPASSSKITYQMLGSLYNQFLRTAIKLTKKDGYLFLYTTEHQSLRKCLRFARNDLEIIEECHMELKNTESVLFIVKRR